MRVTWGSELPFTQLYSTVFNHAFTIGLISADFATLEASSTLEDYTTDDIGDECMVQCSDADVIFALGDVVLAYMAPLYYESDTALNATVAGPVLAIPACGGSRYLSTSTLHQVMMRSVLGDQIWSATKGLIQHFYTSALAGPSSAASSDASVESSLHDLAHVYADWTRDMDKMVTLDQSFALDIVAAKQPMMSQSTNTLVHRDLEELWINTAPPLVG
ncbi:hypothetical protein DYB32_010091 [Aphanomyces invadans]|uniref:Uncharacterized protein n=1 Tax=Aphanomyces invadans TaxID=157072 RepID=A0A418AH33_9STRA|nr:hypothetical protein DYB32_010091 [Aphanomyces invadans]